MKKHILPICSLLFCLFFAQVTYGQINTPCVESDDCFDFTYYGPTFNTNNTVTLNFSVTVNCDHDLSYAAFELPAGAKASAYSPRTKVENSTNSPFHSIKFETKEGFKDGKTADFSYTVTATEFASMTTIQAEAKASTTVGTVSFNAAGCGEEEDDQPINPLPVEFSSFSGKATASGIELAWTTASEKDNDRFEVQRSTNGKDFTTVGTVKGAGNSATTLSYKLTDRKAATGTNYYRINQVDTDGTTALSKVIALQGSATQKTAGISIYPNPVTGNNVNIALGDAGFGDSKFVVIITDMNGRKVFEQQISTAGSDEIKLSLDQMKITKGLYMVKVQGANTTETQKLLVR